MFTPFYPKPTLKKIIFLLMLSPSLWGQSWIDSLDLHGREVYMPANKYKWDWGQGTFLNSLIHLYQQKPAAEKERYLSYLRTAMDVSFDVANGKHPNALASGHAMAFLARISGEQKYRLKADELYQDYLKTPRTSNGGVSHRVETEELWDDTVYMLSMYMLEMYRLTKEEKYIDELAFQVKAHSEKLAYWRTGLWVHGWDSDSLDYDDKCSIIGWADPVTRKSKEYWGRANGWIAMAMVDIIETLPPAHPQRQLFINELNNLVRLLPVLQHKETGHWFQLLDVTDNPANFLESSCTAMFGYAMSKGIRLGVLPRVPFQASADLAYQGIKKYSLAKVDGGAYLTPKNVSGGTCIGSRSYYFNRPQVTGTGFGIASFILFGLEYEKK